VPAVVQSITILGGHDKNGIPEEQELVLSSGDVAVVVGPTGSGKSRLLADIEYLAQGDTPSGRHILINGIAPSPEERFGIGSKLIAQLSQNMNFVLDASVGEFIHMHAACLKWGETSASSDGGSATASGEVTAAKPLDIEALSRQVLEQANALAGEAFSLETPLTSLSGGQSRALMIADTAILSDCPIVLIDEIENAGIDKQLALEVLIRRQKIVLMATHDPILALSGHYRLVLGNGALRQVLHTSEEEHRLLEELRTMDKRLGDIRHSLRAGQRLDRSLWTV
jgi:ABC-type lipoprotein export system ATPase subunit